MIRKFCKHGKGEHYAFHTEGYKTTFNREGVFIEVTQNMYKPGKLDRVAFEDKFENESLTLSFGDSYDEVLIGGKTWKNSFDYLVDFKNHLEGVLNDLSFKETQLGLLGRAKLTQIYRFLDKKIN